MPYRQHFEGSTIFLPRPVDRIFAVKTVSGGVEVWSREWVDARWSEPRPADGITLAGSASHDRLELRLEWPGDLTTLAQTWREGVWPALLWSKDLAQNDGWGALLAHGAAPPDPAYGDAALAEQELGPAADNGDSAALVSRWRKPAPPRARIYQLFPRLFGNTNERRKPNGTMEENGAGKFAHISTEALAALRDELHITHLWLTGVLAHATGTAFPEIGKPADDPDLLKGIAGSPYAIRDYGDVAADLAVEPARRLEEFKELLQRIHAAGLRPIIDFVPNHVARSHASSLVEFGKEDDTAWFFSPGNHFFWLQPDHPGGGAPLRLPTVQLGKPVSPTCQVLGGCDGVFDLEEEHARATGNNAATWSPSLTDWYETVKLNYGHDFMTGWRGYPHAGNPRIPIPDTWSKMDQVLAYWQGLGVAGFRCDMAHMVPPEFWQWLLGRARQRDPRAFFIAEAYNNDPMKVEGGDPLLRGFGNVSVELLNAGFDAVYDDPAYKALKRVFDQGGWANDLDGALGVHDGTIAPHFVFHRSLRYAENHDEVRLAAGGHWGNAGMDVGRAVSAILWGLSRGPILLYNGQEVGEPASGTEGFGGDDGRTSIFDYWSMPEFCRWVNGHQFDGGRLSIKQRDLRAFYGRLIQLMDQPAFREGEFIPLNPLNVANPAFGRMPSETASGHWLYAFARASRGEICIVVANLHAEAAFNDVEIILPADLISRLRMMATGAPATLQDQLGSSAAAVTDRDLPRLRVTTIPALTPACFNIQMARP